MSLEIAEMEVFLDDKWYVKGLLHTEHSAIKPKRSEILSYSLFEDIIPEYSVISVESNYGPEVQKLKMTFTFLYTAAILDPDATLVFP